MRAKVLLVAGLLAIALVLALLFGTSGHPAVSPRNNLELTSAETWGTECIDSFATLSVEIEGALKVKDSTQRHDQLEAILGKREQLCTTASVAMKTAIDDHVYNAADLATASQRIADYQRWLIAIRQAVDQFESGPTEATLAYLRSLMH